MQSVEWLRQSVTDGVADWLGQLIETMPDLAPLRRDPTSEDPAAAGWLHWFVREVVTTNPVTRDALPNIHIFLIEFALDCLDWNELVRDPRFRASIGRTSGSPSLDRNESARSGGPARSAATSWGRQHGR
jgi:hypothetical protein